MIEEFACRPLHNKPIDLQTIEKVSSQEELIKIQSQSSSGTLVKVRNLRSILPTMMMDRSMDES